MTRSILLALLAVLMVVPAAAQEEAKPELPFTWPVPEGWNTETIHFPIVFAPELEYTGLEELRFAPGWSKAGAEDFWSYSFVWWLEPGTEIEGAQLASDLSAYFRGLVGAAAKGREISFETTLDRVEGAERPTWSGTVATFDSFTTQEPLTLEVAVERFECGTQATVYLFKLSPQPKGHATWKTLDEVGRSFRCPSADSAGP